MGIGDRLRYARKSRGFTQDSVSYTHLDVYKRQTVNIR